ncbi:MAG: outer membrane lipoprotein carrier protein LolA [Bdellovibrionota bacterium]
MNQKKRMFAWLLVCVACLGWIHAKKPNVADQILNDLIQTYTQLDAFQAEFSQRYQLVTAQGQQAGPQDQASGTLKVQKPNRMIWEYQNPTKRIFLADGKQLTLTDYGDKQSITAEQSQTQAFPILIQVLLGKVDVEKEYDVTLGKEDEGPEGKWFHLVLTPKATGQDQAQSISLWVEKGPKTLIKKSQVLDPFGGSYTIEYEYKDLHPTFDDKTFVHEIPKDFAVVPMTSFEGMGF